MNDRQPSPRDPGIIPLIIASVFGAVFALIGVTVIVAMWMMPFNDFHSPPVFFRVFASLIAVCFVVMGGGMAMGGITGAISPRPGLPTSAETPSVGYVCPQCGSALGKNSEVSPMGDVKCSFCQRWFNIHRPTTG